MNAGLWNESRQAWKGLAPFAWPHRSSFVKGGLAAVLVVIARVALPWPLRAATDRWILEGGGTLESAPLGLDPVIRMGLAFAGLLFLLGLADHLVRLQFSRFAIGVVRDVRRKILKNAARQGRGDTRAGDLLARLIGDSARIKSGIRGFLVHVVTGGLVLLGVTTALFVMDVGLGLVFLAAGGAVLGITYLGASRLFALGLRQRKKEGKLADEIHGVLSSGPDKGAEERPSLAKLNRQSGTQEATLTRIQGRITWATFTVFGLATFVALVVGSHAVRAGRVEASDMVVFLLYALMMRGPMVRVARQGSRLGKTVAGTHRLLQAIRFLKKGRKRRSLSRDSRRRPQSIEKQAYTLEGRTAP